MPRKKAKNHKVIHFEIPTKDAQKSMKFYSEVLGWEFMKWEGPINYWFTKSGPKSAPGIEGAIGEMEDDETTAGVTNTIGVSDIDEIIKKIKKNGGKIINEKHPIPGVGYLAYFTDLDGNIFGVMQDDPNAK